MKSMRIRHYILFFAVVALAASCRQQTGSLTFTENERATFDSLLRQVHGIDSTRLMAENFRKSGNVLGQIMSLRKLGKLYREDSQFTQAIDCHQQELTLAAQVRDTLEMVQALNNIGTNYRRLGSLEEAASFHQQAVVLTAQMSDQTSERARKNSVVSLNGMGNVLMSLGNLEQADSIFRLSLQGEVSIGSKLGQAINLANLGSIKSRQGLTDSARIYFQQSLQMNEQAGSKLGVGLCHIRFGELEEKDGQTEKAIDEYQTAYQLLEQVGDDWHWLEAVLNIARIDIRNGKVAEAQPYLDMASQTVTRIGSQEHQVEVYRLYYELYEKKGMLRQALDNYILATTLQDSLVNMNKLNNIQNQRLVGERQRRQHELELAQESLALEHSQKTTMLVAAVAILLLAIIIVGMMVHRLRSRAAEQRMMQQLQRARENFFTNITHEFRTPLTVILGLGHQLEENSLDDVAQVRSSAKMIVRQGNSLLRLINQLLDISKVRSAAGEPKWQHGNIVAFVGMVMENFRPYAESKRQDLTYTHSLTTLEMDFVPDYVEKIMSNLLSNAIKFTPAYGKVNVTLEQSGSSRLKIQVFDTGRGIKEEALPHIFDAFFQGDAQAADVGTGVGLSLVRLMAEGMNGSVSAESVEGQGSTFTVVLPIRNKVAAANEGERSLLHTATPSSSTALGLSGENAHDTAAKESEKKTILIIEDNQDIAFYIGMQLPDCRLLYAHGGEEGLAKALDTVPDIIITDIMMPGTIDGLEFCRRVRQSELLCHIPVIIVTAKTNEADRIRGLQAGADAYLMKPFNAEELLVRVNKLFERQQVLRKRFQLPDIDDEQKVKEMSDRDRTFINHLVDAAYKLMSAGTVDMDTLAREMAVSRTQLNRKVLAITGQSASAFVMKQRLARAKRLLKADDSTPIGEVAQRCGFEDVAYFSRVFKQTFQMTPTQYRKQET